MRMREEIIEEIEYLFLDQLGPITAKYYHKGWIYPSNGPEEQNHNNAVACVVSKIVEYVREGKIHPIDGLTLLFRYQPTTQKTKPENYPEHYVQAEKAWNVAVEEIMKKIDNETAQILSPDLQRLWKRAKAYTADSIEFVYENWTIRFERNEKKDAWHLFIWNRDTNQKFTSEPVSIGHLSARKLRMQANICQCEDTTITVIIDHPENYRRYICSEYCKLPVKAIIKLEGGIFKFEGWRRCVQS